jgi:hypothetical protein
MQHCMSGNALDALQHRSSIGAPDRASCCVHLVSHAGGVCGDYLLSHLPVLYSVQHTAVALSLCLFALRLLHHMYDTVPPLPLDIILTIPGRR